MNTPDNIGSNGRSRKVTTGNIEGLLRLCRPVTVTLTRLTMKEINLYRKMSHLTKKKQKLSITFKGKAKRTQKLSRINDTEGIVNGKMNSRKKTKKKNKGKVKDAIDVEEQQKPSKKTGFNNNKNIMGVTKTDIFMEEKDNKVEPKRKRMDAVDKVENLKRQKKIPVRSTQRNQNLDNLDLNIGKSKSTVPRKPGRPKRKLRRSKKLHVSLKKLEDMNSDMDVDVWKTKSSEKETTKMKLTNKGKKLLIDPEEADSLHLTVVDLTDSYSQISSCDETPNKNNSKLDVHRSTNLRKVQRHSQQTEKARSLRKSERIKKHSLINYNENIQYPVAIATKQDSQERSGAMSSSALNNEHTKSKLENYLDKTQEMYETDDEQDLIDEISTLTNCIAFAKDRINAQDKTHDISSPEIPPTYSPILGKSTAKKYSIMKEKRRTIPKCNRRTGQFLAGSRSVSVLEKRINKNFDDSDSITSEEAIETRKTRAQHLHEIRKQAQSTRPMTRSQSRMAFHPPSSDSSRSPSPEAIPVSNEKTFAEHGLHESKKREPVKSVRGKSSKPRGRGIQFRKRGFGRRTTTVTTDATNDAENELVNVDDCSSSSVSISEDRLRNETVKPRKNRITASIQDSPSTSRESSAARSPLRASNSTPSPVSPNTTASSFPETSCSPNICIADALQLQDKHEAQSDMESSEDEDSIELVIDEDPIKDGSDSTPTTLSLSSTDKQMLFENFDQDQVVPMHETPSKLSSSIVETDVGKSKDNLKIIQVEDPKRSKSMAPTDQSTIADDPEKKGKSVLKFIQTKRMSVLGRASLSRSRGEKKSQSKGHSKSRHSTSSKCIVCDTEFASFALLQEHLRTHSGRQSPSTAGILATDPCSVSMLNANTREQTFQDTGIPSTMFSKTVCSVESSSKGNEPEDSVSITTEKVCSVESSSKGDKPEDSVSLTAKTVCLAESSSKVNEPEDSVSIITEASESIVESTDESSTVSTKSQSAQKKSKARSTPSSTKTKHRKFRVFNATNICSICSHTFESKEKLADHIFTHTEEDLQAAYESAANVSREMNQEASKPENNVESPNQPTVVTTINIESQEIDGGNTSSNIVSENTKTDQSKPAIVEGKEKKRDKKKRDSQTPKKSSESNSSSRKKDRKSTSRKEVSPKKNHSKDKNANKSTDRIEVITVEEPEKNNTTLEKEKSPRTSIDGNTPCDVVVGVTKPITVCECHKQDVTHGNFLRIEVSLLCHACRVIYRSMECFEIHYRLPQHAQCNKNRLHGRSPKLFCTNCGMIFSSIQDVRQHLELHARFNTRVSTDFRCNLCKVIFIGIGTLFYVHWSNHLKNPLYIASKLSFPKSSVLVQKKNKYVSASKEPISDQYLYVAEYICTTCRQPFATEMELEKHKPECKKLPKNKEKILQNEESTKKDIPRIPSKEHIPQVHTEERVEYNDVKTQPKIRLVCGICEHAFSDKLLFKKHAELEHNREPPKPQYICVALTTMNTVFSCSACSKMFGKLSDLEDHWKTHTAKRERYMCKNCSKFHESLESFMEHAKQHLADPKIDEVSCKVIYHDTEFVCKLCQLGFDTKLTMNKHFEMHGVNWQNPTNINSSLIQSVINPLVQTMCRPIAPALSKEKEKPKEPEIMIVENVVSNERNEVIPNIGQEEAENSEGELVIDYREISEDDRLQKTLGKLTPDTLSIPTANSRTTTGTVETPNSVENSNIDEKARDEVASTSQNSETPKKGFLRVKTLAELTSDSATSSHQCFICKFVPENLDGLATHILEVHSSLSPQEIASYKQTHRKQTENVPESSDQVQNNPENKSQASMETSSDCDRHPMLLLNGRLVKFTIKSKPPEPYQIQKPTWHRSEDQPVPKNHLTKSVSGYHKNLPACPSTRPQTSSMYRVPGRTIIPPRSKDSSNSSAVLKIPHPRPATQSQHDGPNTTMIPTTVYELESAYTAIPVPSTSGRGSTRSQAKRQGQSEVQGEGYRCRICPDFRGASVSDYILHELSPKHEENKRRNEELSSNIENPLRTNYLPPTTEATSNIPTSRIPPTHERNQQQECVQEVYARPLYREPIIYVSPGQGDRMMNYAIPANVYVNTGISQSVTPLNTQALIMPNRANVYQPVVFNNPNGIAVMGNSGAYVQSNFTCCFCAKTFASEAVLRHHINIYHPYVCSVCREAFGTAHELETHKTKHPCAWG